MASLTRVEAGTRSALIDVSRYTLDLDLDRGATSFGSSSTVRFGCAEPGASTFLDVKTQQLQRVTLNGVDVDLRGFDGERITPHHHTASNAGLVTTPMSTISAGQDTQLPGQPACTPNQSHRPASQVIAAVCCPAHHRGRGER